MDFRVASGRFDFVSFYADGQRSLDRFYGNNQGSISVARDQYALHAIEGSTANSNTLTNLQKGMSRPGQLGFHYTAHRIDFRDRGSACPRRTRRPVQTRLLPAGREGAPPGWG